MWRRNWVYWMAVDGCIILASFLFFYWLRFYTPLSYLFKFRGYPGFLIYLKGGVVTAMVWLFFFKALGVYSEKSFRSFVSDLQVIMEGSFFGMLFMAGLIVLLRQFSYSRTVALYGGILAFFLLSLHRKIQYNFEINSSSGESLKRVIIVGCGKNGEIVLKRLKRSSEKGFILVGFLSTDPKMVGKEINGVKIIGDLGGLAGFVKYMENPKVIITLGYDEWDKMKDAVSLCRENKVNFLIMPDLQEPLFGGTRIEMIHGLPLIGMKESQLKKSGYRFIKRCGDLFLGVLIVLILSPLLLYIIIAIKLTSPGPVFFRQKRIGFRSRPFSIIKFRTMRAEEGGSAWTDIDDARCTDFGKWLRRRNFDELPQLFNVLKGDMSLIGPRPLAVDDVEFQSVSFFNDRHEVKPGMTGWAQINGLRGGHVEPEERIRYDLYYIDNWSIWLDLTILLMTPFSLVNAF